MDLQGCWAVSAHTAGLAVRGCEIPTLLLFHATLPGRTRAIHCDAIDQSESIWSVLHKEEGEGRGLQSQECWTSCVGTDSSASPGGYAVGTGGEVVLC